MALLTEEIEIDVPLKTAYNQWTQFEEFPRFMKGIEAVQQIDDRTLAWHAKIGGKEEHWRAEIYRQEPDRQIAWRSTQGARNNGSAVFEPIDVGRTRVRLTIEYDPKSILEQAGASAGVVDNRVKGDLRRFKEYIETRGRETGAWRGEIPEEPPGMERVDEGPRDVSTLRRR